MVSRFSLSVDCAAARLLHCIRWQKLEVEIQPRSSSPAELTPDLDSFCFFLSGAGALLGSDAATVGHLGWAPASHLPVLATSESKCLTNRPDSPLMPHSPSPNPPSTPNSNDDPPVSTRMGAELRFMHYPGWWPSLQPRFKRSIQ